jgi:hypothetical protein
MDKLKEMLREMEDSLGIWGDIIGGLCLLLLCYAILSLPWCCDG